MMRKLLMLGRIMVAGTRNFFRNAWLNLAATAVMVVTITIMLGAVVFNMALGSTLDQVTDQIDVALYLEDDAPPEVVEELEEELRSLENIRSTRYISKAEALERYQQDNIENEDILEAVSEDDNPLPASIEAEVHDLREIDAVVELAQDSRFILIIDDTSLGEDRRRTIDRIAGAREFLITFGLTSSLIFATISVLIIFNTIRLAIFARGEEIGIMRLIGATNGFIRGPFLFEAMLNGIIAATLSLVFVYAALFRGIGGLVDYVDFESTLAFFSTMWPVVVLATLAFGALIGVFSSLLAMARHLRL